MTERQQTIFALSSGALPSGVAVVRISGPQTFEIIAMLAGPLPSPRLASLRTIRTRNGLILDRGLVLVFPGPSSFTGEDCAELHVHGGPAVVAALLAELTTCRGCRLAENGEFSRRAFENGKIDLLEAEGLADLLAAETEMQRRLAIEHSNGGLSALYADWATQLTRGRALIEAELDFSDEDDIPGSVSDQVWSSMITLRNAIEEHIKQASVGAILRDGLRVAIYGPPNSGKSSLLNLLAQRDIAIVTEIAGTTRDVLEVALDVEGYKVLLYDTAGIRDTPDPVEAEGVRRAHLTMEQADLVLALSEADQPLRRGASGGNIITVGTKLDLHGPQADYDVCISVKTGAGLDELRSILVKEVEQRGVGISMAVPARRRHKLLLEETMRSVTAAIEGLDDGLDVRAEHLRSASQSLGRITGRVDVEDLLGVIFSEFCVGK